MFFLVTITITGHYLYNRLKDKGTLYPLRPVIARIVEILGRIGVILFAILYYGTTWGVDAYPGFKAGLYTIVLIFVISICGRDLGGIKKEAYMSVEEIRMKIDKYLNNVEAPKPTNIECIIFNLVVYKTFNKTMDIHIQYTKNYIVEEVISPSHKVQASESEGVELKSI